MSVQSSSTTVNNSYAKKLGSTRSTSLNYEAWERLLPPNYNDREFLLTGIRDGFHIVDADSVQHFAEVDNYLSATNDKMRARTEKQIINELDNGHYRIVNEKPNIISALGAIPKKSSSRVRLIHDASRPRGEALNDCTTTDHFKYQSISDATEFITPNCFFAKVDLANAYRSVKVHPSNFKATGLKWRFEGMNHDTYMVDERLPFGAARSPGIFHRITQAVRVIMANRGYKTIVVYLDDFLIISETYDECLSALNELMRLLRELGFQLNYNKVEGPKQQLVFLGILIDSINMTLSVPEQKLSELRNDLQCFLNRAKVTKRDIQQLVGKMNWIAQIIYGGRFHIRRLIDRSNSLEKQWYRTRVTKDMKLDVCWWLDFMKIFNGTMPIVEFRPSTSLSIDACKVAAGAFYNGDFIYTPWSNKTASLPINYLEVLSLEPAVQRWAHLWANKRVFVHCDNQAACAIIRKGSSKHPLVMQSLRRIFWSSAIYNFKLVPIYYPGKCNVLSDLVSRLHESNNLQRLKYHMTNLGYL